MSARKTPRPSSFVRFALCLLLGVSGGCEEDGGDVGAGDTDTDGAGTGELDQDSPPCEVGDVRECGPEGSKVQLCGEGATFDECPCVDAQDLPCVPGQTRTVPSDIFPDTDTVEECVLVGCEPTWSDRDGGFTPLALVPHGTVPRLLPYDGRFFSFAGGTCPTDWPTADTPWLVRDLDGNGRIDAGHELFGSDTRIDGRRAQDGFEALAALDADGNGVIDSRDPGYEALLLWADVDGDRRSRPSELLPLSAAGIEAIPLAARHERRCDDRGNCGWERVTLPGGRGEVVDLHLHCR